MVKYIFGFAIVLMFMQCSSVKKTKVETTLVSKILRTYADSIRVTKMSDPTKINFVGAFALLMKEGIPDSLAKSALSKKDFNGYVITNNSTTVDRHENVYCDVFEIINDSVLMRLTYLFAARSSDKNLKMYSEEFIVKSKKMEELMVLNDGPQTKGSKGIILFKIDEGTISKVNVLLNPPEDVLTDLYFGGIKRR